MVVYVLQIFERNFMIYRYICLYNKKTKYIMKFLIVALGSGIGGALRFWISSLAQKFLPVYFPYGTLTVNLLGSFVLGVLIFGFDEKQLLSTNIKLMLTVGLCGGFTTFSTFSFETFNLIKETEFLLAGLNILLNIILTIAGVYLGYLITR